MAFRELSFRVAGIIAMCLAALLVPVAVAERVAVLTAASLGIGAAAIWPRYDHKAARAAGPAVFALAIVPTDGPWVLVALLALFTVGLAAFSHRGLVRVVPALGLPVMAEAFRSGKTVAPGLLGAWLVMVLITLLLANTTQLNGRADAAGRDRARPTVDFGWRRTAQAAMLAMLIAPMAFAGADRFEDGLVGVLTPKPRLGDMAGPSLNAHPGLTGGLDVGAPVNLSDEVVLRVEADEPRLWRGSTYDRWDGRRWTSEVRTEPASWDTPGVQLPPADDVADSPSALTVRQRFRVERSGLDVVLGAWRMDTVFIGPQTAAIGEDGSVRLDQALGAGATWTVDSSIVAATAEDLRRADPLVSPGRGSGEQDRYTTDERYTTEDAVTAEVIELAAAITADAPTTYDKVIALEAWMDANIVYTRDIPTLDAGEDAVAHLLFESRRGFCEQIGTALVVMLRSLGIASRLVVGYVPSEYDSAAGEWISRGTDAHAWAEVYFPGVGWQGFDPTAGVGIGVSNRAGNVAPAMWWNRMGGWAFLGWAAALASALVLVIAWALRRGLASPAKLLGRIASLRCPSARSNVDAPIVIPLLELQERFDSCGRQLGLAWGHAATLREKAEELTATGVASELVIPAAAALEKLWFLEIDHLAGGELREAVAQASDRIESLERSVCAIERELVAPR